MNTFVLATRQWTLKNLYKKYFKLKLKYKIIYCSKKKGAKKGVKLFKPYPKSVAAFKRLE